eukprot:8413672-Alexandrium_andersonii.AAC.1
MQASTQPQANRRHLGKLQASIIGITLGALRSRDEELAARATTMSLTQLCSAPASAKRDRGHWVAGGAQQ